MTKRTMIQRSAPRVCTARRVAAFDKQAVLDRLFAGEGVESDFQIVEQVARPSAESSFDVCTDGEALFVSVLLWESGSSYSTAPQAVPDAGLGNNGVEVLFAPCVDGYGFLQFGAGPGNGTWFNHHWPYHDDRPDLVARPQWSCETHFEKMGEDRVWAAFFRFPLAAITVPGSDGTIGFNVMRVQLRTGEASAWSHAGGNGFCDFTSLGWLRLTASAPRPAPSPLCKLPAVGGYQLQTTYDFPDEMVGGPYTPDVMRRELRFLKAHGVGRVYWIDYPGTVEAVRLRTPGAPIYRAANYDRTIKACGGDPMPVACRIAHEEGIQFFTTIKPYDLWAGDAGVTSMPQCAFRRNPAWTVPYTGQAVETIDLYADNDAPLPFAAEGIRLYASADNTAYEPVPEATVAEAVVERPRTRWSPAGKRPAGGTERVRRLRISTGGRRCRYWAVAFPAAAAPGTFGNQDYLLAEASGGLPATFAAARGGRDFRTAGFDFYHDGSAAGWADSSEGTLKRRTLPAGGVFGLRLGHEPYLAGMLEPGFDEVRRYWLDTFVRRAVAAGADGVDVRIAHHHCCVEWLSYAYAEPVLRAFRGRFGRDPGATASDLEAVRRIRGEFHTQFLREAKSVLAAAGRKLEAHVEARMKTPPAHDTFTQIHWDWATWIDEGIIDGVNLKYLGPLNRWVHREIVPRARRRGIPVHVVDAVGDPRSQPRTPEWAAEMQAMVRAGGLNGLNLYEIWVYLRTTPRGEWFARGCGRAVFAALCGR